MEPEVYYTINGNDPQEFRKFRSAVEKDITGIEVRYAKELKLNPDDPLLNRFEIVQPVKENNYNGYITLRNYDGIGDKQIEQIQKATEHRLGQYHRNVERNQQEGPLHEQVLTFLLNYRNSHSEFTFWLRRRNVKNRLNEGFWFQGNENYAFVGLYKLSGGQNRTRAVGLVFWPYENHVGVSFDVIMDPETSARVIDFLEQVRDILKADYGSKFSQISKFKYSVTLAVENSFEVAAQFLDKYWKTFNEKAVAVGLSEILIYDAEFNNRLAQIQEYRESLKKGNELKIPEESAEEKIQPVKISNVALRDRNEIDAVIGVKEMASEIEELIKHLKPEKGTMIGIFGQWGRGKTFLFEKVWENLEKRKQFYRVDFHAWKYQDTSAAWAYLYECMADGYYSGNWIHRFWKTLKLNWVRDGKWDLLLLLVGIITSIISTVFAVKDIERSIYNLIPILAFIPTLYQGLRKNWTRAKFMIRKYSTRFSLSNLLGIQAEIEKELKTLLKVWINEKKTANSKDIEVSKRIVLFVDDIDRCKENRIIEIVDALRVMLEDDSISKRIVVVMAVDERILKRAIKTKYSRIKSSHLLEILTTEYFDKLFIAGLKLPILNQFERIEILNSVIGKRIENTGNDFETQLFKDFDLVEYVTGENNKVKNETPSNDPPLPKRPEIENDLSEEQSDQKPIDQNQTIDELHEISNIEKGLIDQAISALSTATPRQIRILYFRYILCKNIIMRCFKNSNWGSIDHIRILLQLLVLATNKNLGGSELRKNLSKDIDLQTHSQMQEDQDPNRKMENRDELLENSIILEFQNLPRELYHSVLSALEIVKAY